MTETDYLPKKDVALANWGINFSAVAEANETVLKVTGAQVNAFDSLASAFAAANDTVATAKQAAKTATTARRMARKAMVADARALVKQIQGTAGIPDTLKTQLGITISAGRRPVVPVFQPLMLSATVQSDLRVYLKWDKNGNHYGCLYVIERQCAGETTWTQLEKQTSSRFHDTGCTPGVKATYRVTATRGAVKSVPSPVAVVY